MDNLNLNVIATTPMLWGDSQNTDLQHIHGTLRSIDTSCSMIDDILIADSRWKVHGRTTGCGGGGGGEMRSIITFNTSKLAI